MPWDGHDEAWPDTRTTDGEGNAEFPAPPAATPSMCRRRARIVIVAGLWVVWATFSLSFARFESKGAWP